MKFHPNGKWAYVLNELTLSVTACTYDADHGVLTPIETVPTIDEAVKSQEQFNSASTQASLPSSPTRNTVTLIYVSARGGRGMEGKGGTGGGEFRG